MTPSRAVLLAVLLVPASGCERAPTIAPPPATRAAAAPARPGAAFDGEVVTLLDDLAHGRRPAGAPERDVVATLAEHPEDPLAVLFVSAALRAADPELRALGARCSAVLPGELVAWRRAEALAVETDRAATLALIAAMSGRRPQPGQAAILAARHERALAGADAEIAARAAAMLFEAGGHRVPGLVHRAAWPGRADDVSEGWSMPRGDGPGRRPETARARLAMPPSTAPRHLLVGFDGGGGVDVEVEIALDDRALGIVLVPGAAREDGEPTVAAFAIPEGWPASVVGFDFGRSASPVAVRGAVIVEAELLGERHRPRFIALATDAPWNGQTIASTVHRQVFTLEEGEADRITELHLDHRGHGAGSAIWDVALNGRPLLVVAASEAPKTARAFFDRRGGARPVDGVNELVLTRREGGALVLDGVRLLR